MADKSGSVILDFDGTVADSFLLAVEIAQRILEHFKYPVPTTEEFYAMRELSAAQLLRRMKVSPRHLPSMVRMVRRLLKENDKVIKPIEGIESVLAGLSKEYKVAIISSNTPDVIEDFLQRHQMRECIDEIVGTVALFQKNRALKRFVRDHELDPNRVVYVGDEVRDVEAAHRARMQVVAVGWGYNSHKRLTKAQPDALVDTPAELAKAIATLLPRQAH